MEIKLLIAIDVNYITLIDSLLYERRSFGNNNKFFMISENYTKNHDDANIALYIKKIESDYEQVFIFITKKIILTFE